MRPDLSSDAAYAAAFAASLLDPARETPGDRRRPARARPLRKRYAVYRNNVTVSLIDALAAVYPAVQRITGADFFRAMARFHIRETPPTSPLLFEYGRDFPDFIARYPHAEAMPWLADVARLERAWLDAYHAADAPALGGGSWPTSRPSASPISCFKPIRRRGSSAPSFAAVAIFAANRERGPVERIDASEPEDALVTRPNSTSSCDASRRAEPSSWPPDRRPNAWGGGGRGARGATRFRPRLRASSP